MRTRSSLVALIGILALAGCGKDWEPGVAAIVSLAPVMAKHRSDCAMVPKNFGEEANTFSDALMKMPSAYQKTFPDESAELKKVHGSKLDAPCTTIVDGAKQCRADGSPAISGFGQQVIDICKVVKGVSGKL